MTKLKKGLLFFLALAAIFVSTNHRVLAQTAPTQASFFLTQGADCSPQPVTELTIVQAPQPFTLNLCLNTNASPVNGFDLTINYGSSLTLTSVSEQSDGNKFEGSTAYGPPGSIDNTNHTFRYAKVTTNSQDSLPQGTLFLATLTFTPSSPVTTGTIEASNPVVISPSSTPTTSVSNFKSVSYGPPTVQGDTYVSFALPLQDVYNPNNPLTTILPAIVCLYNPNTDIVSIKNDFSSNPCATSSFKANGNIVYKNADANGNAVFGSPGTYFDLGSTITSGSYIIAIKPAGYLAYITTNPVTITAGTTPQGTTNVIPTPANPLIAGDINGDNIINILDYEELETCGFMDVNPQPLDSNSPPICQTADLNHDGVVDGIDFNIWDRGLSTSTNSTNNTPTLTPTITITPTVTPGS